MNLYYNDSQEEAVSEALQYYRDAIEDDPQKLYSDITAELETLYIRFENDQEGRGIVGDSRLSRSIATLEAVRAECLKRVRQG